LYQQIDKENQQQITYMVVTPGDTWTEPFAGKPAGAGFGAPQIKCAASLTIYRP
jgi:hypothetical protein